MRAYLDQTVARLGVQRNTPSFWRQYAQNTLTKHFPKFSAWFGDRQARKAENVGEDERAAKKCETWMG